ncbi:MAG TPA: DUF3887 domain-containing protein [Candidatus Hydrogenedentes bacterium]|nr:DUF3887 domain-containing protein [Candidatus Hydrogenedentota bacterium]HPG66274.1 DUF3887 domain-containing protein [Candidatus Hydrogenedentota bacterium]
MDKKVIVVVAVVIAVIVLLPLGVKMTRGSAPVAPTVPAAPSGAAAADVAETAAAPDSAGATDAVSVARQVAQAWATEDMAAVTARFDATMKAALTEAQLSDVLHGIIGQNGPFKGLAGARTETKQGYDVIYVTCEFDRGKVDLQVALDAARQIAGLYVRPSAS